MVQGAGMQPDAIGTHPPHFLYSGRQHVLAEASSQEVWQQPEVTDLHRAIWPPDQLKESRGCLAVTHHPDGNGVLCQVTIDLFVSPVSPIEPVVLPADFAIKKPVQLRRAVIDSLDPDPGLGRG